MKFYILLILFFSCADIFIPDDNSYRSVYLDGNAWIEIEDQYDCENGLRVIDDSFLIEIFHELSLLPYLEYFLTVS